MRRITALILIFAISGCATLNHKPRPWTKEEKVMLVCSLCAAGADCYTAERLIDCGGRELNPLFSPYPTDAELVFKGGALYGVFLLIAHHIPELRKILLMGQTTMCTGFAEHNARVLREMDR